MQGIINSDHFSKKAGLCAIINDHLSLAYKHYLEYGDLNIVINNRELSSIFNLKTSKSSIFSYDMLLRHQNFINPFSSNAHNIPSYSQLKLKKWIFNELFEIKKSIYQNLSFDLSTPDKLAIHYRGTDKKYEIQPPDLHLLFKNIQNKLSRLNLAHFYLATDDLRILNKFTKHFGEAVLFHKKNHYSKRVPLHFTKNRSTVNLQLVGDIIRLAKSEIFYYSYSNVSHLALILGIDNNQLIIQSNSMHSGYEQY